MKHFIGVLTRLVSVVMLLLVAGGAWAEETVVKTLTFSSETNSKAVSAYTAAWAATVDGFTWDIANFNNNNNGWTYIKCGSKNDASVATITTNTAINEAITKVVVTIDAITATNVNSIKLYTSSTNDFSSPIETLEVEKAKGEQTITISAPASNLYYQLQFDCKKGASNGIITVSKVEYYANVVSDLTPANLSFTPSTVLCTTGDDVEVAFAKDTDAEVTFTNSNPDVATFEDGVLHALAAGTAIITANCEANETYTVGKATLKVTVGTKTIADFKALAVNTTAALQLTDAVVTAVASNGNTYIQDATGGICLYLNVPEYKVGQRLNGTVIGTYAEYSTLPELSTGDYTNVTATDGEAIAPKEVNIDDITAADYCTLVTIKNAHCTQLAANAIVSQDANDGTVKVYTTFMAASKFPAYQNFDVTGILGVYNGAAQILPRSADDFTEIGGEKETILTFAKDSYEFYTNATGTIVATVNSGATITYTSSDTNILAIASDGSISTGNEAGTVTVTASVPEHNGYPAAEATVTVTVTKAETVTWVMLVAKMGDRYYAMSSETGAVKSSLAAVEVRVKNGVALVENIDNNLLWTVDANKGYIKSYEKLYLTATSSGTNLTVSSQKTQWTNDADNGYWLLGTRAAIATKDNKGIYFKNYATSNITKSNYSTAVIEMPYAIFTPEAESISISSVGYATMYYSDKHLVVPAGVEAQTYTVEGNVLSVSHTYTEGEAVPAGEAVVLHGTEGTYDFAEAYTTTNDRDAANKLLGTDEAATTTGGDKFYKLSLNSDKDPDSVGFYWGAENGAPFTNGAHKAYLALTTESAVRSFFTFEDIATGIHATEAAPRAEVYTLSGMRVKGTPKAGLYIINGKKMMVK